MLILSDDVVIINQDLKGIVSDSWLTCIINGSCLITIYTCFIYDNRKYVNVNSFIGHSVVLQYVTVHRVEHLKCQNFSESKLDAITS